MRASLVKKFVPAGLGSYCGMAHQKAIRTIHDAVDNHEMLAVVGEYGRGKSELVDMAARDKTDAKWIYIQTSDKERLNIGGIQGGIITAFEKHPKRANVAASAQLARLLGEHVVRGKRRVVVVIDEAHRLHANTIRAIRDLRELRYAGHSHMLAVILIGQPPLIDKIDLFGEVRLRFDILHLSENRGWMTQQERVQYIMHRFGAALTPAAAQRIALLEAGPLHIDRTVEKLFEKALAAGLDVVDVDLLDLSPKEQARKLGLTNAEVARRAGIGPSTVTDAFAGRSSEATNRKIARALQAVEAERLGEGVAA